MKNTLSILAATAAVGLAFSSFAAEESTAKSKSKTKYYDNGGYETTTTAEKTNTDGTTSTSEDKVGVDVDSKGNARKIIKTETTTNPKGMLNQKTEQAETQIEEKSRGGYKQITTRKHADADGTNIAYKTTTDVDVDTSGNVTTTATTEKTVDPKGLMNSSTTSSTTKTVNGTVVESTSKPN